MIADWLSPTQPPRRDRLTLPVASTIATHRGLICGVVATTRAGHMAAVAAYVRDDGTRHVWGEWHEFGGDRWQRVLNLGWRQYVDAVRPVAPEAAAAPWSRLMLIAPTEVAAATSARDPQLLAAHRPRLEALADYLDVPVSALGLYGSTLYKPPERCGDCDFVVYGAVHSRRAWDRIQAARRSDCHALKHHQHFRVPRSTAVYDPRFVDDNTITGDLLSGRAAQLGVEPLDAVVVDDTDGLFLPARYVLDDGTTLASWRLGHAGLLHPGDRIRHPGLPVVQVGMHQLRAVLRWETLDISRAKETL